MYIDFSKLFHNSSKDHSGGGTVRVPKDDSQWPDEWKTTYYKDYPRFEKITLDRTTPKADFFELIAKRKSDRNFSGKPVDKKTLSTLLRYSAGITTRLSSGRARRAHPSGGARFPIEIYPIIFSGDKDISAGLYHYNIKEHSLDVLWQRPFNKTDIGELFTYEWVQNASLAIVMTAVFARRQSKYGERGYRCILLEAGHIGQNIYLNAEALGLSCVALSGTRDKNLEKLIDIDGITESVVYGLALG